MNYKTLQKQWGAFWVVASLVGLETTAQAQVACRSVYLTADVSVGARQISEPSYPNTSSWIPKEVASLSDKIRQLSDQRDSLSRKIREIESDLGRRDTLPYFEKSTELRSLESKISDLERSISSEVDRVERLSSRIEESIEANAKKENSEKEKDTILFTDLVMAPFVYVGSMFKKKPQTAEEIENAQEMVAELKSSIASKKAQLQSLNNIMAPLLKRDLAAYNAKLIKEKNESQEKLVAIQGTLIKAQAIKKSVESQIQTEVSARTREVMKDPRLFSSIRDSLSIASIELIPKANKVTLLIGNEQDGKPTLQYQRVLEIKEIITELVKRKYYVVFDGQSAYAQAIATFAGEYGIGVVASSKAGSDLIKNKMVIKNDYQRMKLLAESRAVVISPDSVVGIGLFLEGLATHVLDTTKKFKTDFIESWVKELNRSGRNLGVSEKSAKLLKNPKDLFDTPPENFRSWDGPWLSEVKEFVGILKAIPESFRYDGLVTMVNDAISFAKVSNQNEDTGGSVIFGSGKIDEKSAELIYASAYKLGQNGVAVATGGAGGAMEIANTGAWNSGGPSIGIPIGGKHTLETEKTFATSKQTKTIITSGYEERIPTLLGEGPEARRLIIFAPGGNGTIKELATTLVRAGARSKDVQHVVFLDSNYYSSLVKWLKEIGLPASFVNKLEIFDRSEDVEALALISQTDAEKSRMQAPRNPQPTFFPPKAEKPKKEKRNDVGAGSKDKNQNYNGGKSFQDLTTSSYENEYGFVSEGSLPSYPETIVKTYPMGESGYSKQRGKDIPFDSKGNYPNQKKKKKKK